MVLEKYCNDMLEGLEEVEGCCKWFLNLIFVIGFFKIEIIWFIFWLFGFDYVN